MERNEIKQALLHVSEIELVYRPKVKASERPFIQSSRYAFEVFLALWEEGKLELDEQFKVLFLNRANHVVAVYNISSGGITGTVADPD